MIITDTLNGHTVEDVRRNQDGSVTLYTDNGRVLTLHVACGRIEVRPQAIVLPGVKEQELPSQRMRLREAFVGQLIHYATYDENGFIHVVCEPLLGTEKYSKALGHREIKLTHTGGLIDELPPVSAIISLEPLSIFGEAQG